MPRRESSSRGSVPESSRANAADADGPRDGGRADKKRKLKAAKKEQRLPRPIELFERVPKTTMSIRPFVGSRALSIWSADIDNSAKVKSIVAAWALDVLQWSGREFPLGVKAFGTSVAAAVDLRKTVKAVRSKLPVKDGRLQFTLVWPADGVGALASSTQKSAGHGTDAKAGSAQSAPTAKVDKQKRSGSRSARPRADVRPTSKSHAKHGKEARKSKREKKSRRSSAKRSRGSAKEMEAREAMYLKIEAARKARRIEGVGRPQAQGAATKVGEKTAPEEARRVPGEAADMNVEEPPEDVAPAEAKVAREQDAEVAAELELVAPAEAPGIAAEAGVSAVAETNAEAEADMNMQAQEEAAADVNVEEAPETDASAEANVAPEHDAEVAAELELAVRAEAACNAAESPVAAVAEMSAEAEADISVHAQEEAEASMELEAQVDAVPEVVAKMAFEATVDRSAEVWSVTELEPFYGPGAQIFIDLEKDALLTEPSTTEDSRGEETMIFQEESTAEDGSTGDEHGAMELEACAGEGPSAWARLPPAECAPPVECMHSAEFVPPQERVPTEEHVPLDEHLPPEERILPEERATVVDENVVTSNGVLAEEMQNTEDKLVAMAMEMLVAEAKRRPVAEDTSKMEAAKRFVQAQIQAEKSLAELRRLRGWTAASKKEHEPRKGFSSKLAHAGS
mmetsp:Transcript_89572/g.252443  ORF Transcript_89572/g.252443 Transcript_89572/m.252443 type:complete len:683 (-) Transcript_89572:452-2500(-)